MSITREILDFSNENNIDAKLLQAVINVESAGSGFNDSGELKIRFEAHLILNDYPNLSRWFKLGEPSYLKHFMRFPSYSNEWKMIHTGKQFDEFTALLIAAHTIGHDAWKYASFGSGQILAKFHYEKLGFTSAIEMYSFMSQSQTNDINVWLNLIKISPNYLIPLQKRDLYSFARNYNGSGNVEYYVKRFNEELVKL